MSNKGYMVYGNGDYSCLGSIQKDNKYGFEYKREDFDINATDNSRAAITRLIKENSLVLDIGCSTGFLGNILKDFKNATIDGIEYEKPVYEILKKNKNYRNVYNFSIEDNLNKDFIKLTKQKEKYDYIILGDVLEHLVSPDLCLKNLYSLLDVGGKIIVSVPNIAHIDIIRGLINKDFNYRGVGILDNTHLRFFTTQSFIDMVNNINNEYNLNYSLEYKDSIKYEPIYVKNLNYKDMNMFDLDLNDYLVLQMVFILEKVKDKKSIKYKYPKKKDDVFDDILELVRKHYYEIDDLKELLSKYNNDYKNLDKDYKNLNKLYNNLNNEYLNIVNSRGWKFLEKLRNIKRKIFKR